MPVSAERRILARGRAETKFITWLGHAMLALAPWLVAVPAAGQDQPAAQTLAPARPNSGPISTGWLKYCDTDTTTGKLVCLVTQEMRTEEGQTLAAVMVRDIEDAPQNVLAIAVPIGVLLEPGVQVKIDEQKSIKMAFTICISNACLAEAPVEDALVTSFKRGNDVVVSVLNQQQQAINFKLSLVGFTKAYDGDPIEPERLKQQEIELKEELQRKVIEERGKILEGNADN